MTASEKQVVDWYSKSELRAVEIQNILPHRYPFLLVDRITEITENYAIGYKNVTITEPFFQGHFPQLPIMPGVLIIETMAQIAGIVALKRRRQTGTVAFLTGIDGARFREPVVPGDKLVIRVEIVKEKARLLIADCTATVGEKKACEAQVMFALIDG